jgi:hypothetical protein
MEKFLIYENKEQIEAIRGLHTGTVNNLNRCLEAFHEVQTEHRITTEAEALKFAEDPMQHLFAVNGGAGTRFDKKEIPGLYQFRAAIQKIATGSAKHQFKIGIHLKTAGYRINAENKKLIQWLPELKRFSIITQELDKLCEPYRRYAKNEAQIKKIHNTEQLVDLLNSYHMPGNPDHRAEVASLLGLHYYDGYSINYEKLSNTI